jgi:HEAT repeat protein
MKRWRRRFWLGIGLGLLLLLLARPATTIVAALLRGEPFYLCRPSSFWAEVVRGWSGQQVAPLPRWLPPWAVRIVAYTGYGTSKPAVLHGGPSCVPVLIELAREDDAAVRLQAIAGLGDWACGRNPVVVIPVLREALTDRHPDIALLAATCMAGGGIAGEMVLFQALWELPPERASVIFPALRSVGERGAAEYLWALRHPNGRVRGEALQCLRRARPVTDLESEDYLTRVMAVAGCSREYVYSHEDEPPIASLRALLGDRDGLLRVLAAEALCRRSHGDKDVLRVVVAAAEDADVAARWNAARVLYGPRYLVWEAQQERILATLGDTDWPVQELAETWLLNAGPYGVALLVKALHASEPRTRRAAARALCKIDADTIWLFSYFLDDLKDMGREIREEVARVLKAHGP